MDTHLYSFIFHCLFRPLFVHLIYFLTFFLDYLGSLSLIITFLFNFFVLFEDHFVWNLLQLFFDLSIL